MNGNYTVGSVSAGKYASQLEAQWAREFFSLGWPANYVGDSLRYADFILKPGGSSPFYVEIKPECSEPVCMDPFIIQATERFKEAGLMEAMLICGRPRGPFTNWFFWTPAAFKRIDKERDETMTLIGRDKVLSLLRKELGNYGRERLVSFIKGLRANVTGEAIAGHD